MKLYFFINIIFAKLYTVKLPGSPELALTITSHSVGFEKYDEELQSQKLEIKDGIISKNNKKLCTAATSSEVRLCTSKNPINAEFILVSSGNLVKFITKGNHILAIGDFNESTQMYDVAILEENKTLPKNFNFSVIPIDSDSSIDTLLFSKNNEK